jgi:hypothetical protein
LDIILKFFLSISYTSFASHSSISGNWKNIIDMFHGEVGEGNDCFYDEHYLWVRPSEENLHFIKQQIVKAGCCQLISIGCGSGLLEWLIHKATGKNSNCCE